MTTPEPNKPTGVTTPEPPRSTPSSLMALPLFVTFERFMTKPVTEVPLIPSSPLAVMFR